MKATLYKPSGYEFSIYRERGKCGPGSGIGDKLVPEKILFLRVTEACRIHDYMYHQGKTHEDKEVADRVLKYNMLRLIDAKGGWLKWPRVALAEVYYQAVVRFGGPAYWDSKNPDEDKIEVFV